MGHGITTTDNLFTVREPAWHGLGTVFEDYPTREEAQRLAHPWEPVSEPLYRRVPTVDPSSEIPLAERYEEVPGYVAQVRSDNGHTLGVTGDGYVSVKNSEMYDIAEALEDGSDDVLFETGGSIGGGSRVWLMMRLREPITPGDDPNGATIPYYLLQNAHNGSGSFKGQATMVRVVCQNTMQVADMDSKARGTEFTFRHTRNVGDRIEQAKAALAGWRHSVQEWRLLVEHLQTLRVDEFERTEFLHRFIPDPPPGTISERVRANIDQARATFTSILDGPTCEGIRDNAYGLVAASAEYAEHYRRANSRETRFKRAILDRNSVLQDATKLALQVV